MYRIVEHPAYAGMPSTTDPDGKIDWTIPSYRPRGSKNWDGNTQRKAWWRQKAEELGIPRDGQWISKAAKAIHPFDEKPCQTCGRVMKLAYVYPTARALRRINVFLPEDAQLEVADLFDIYEVIDHLVEEVGLPAATAALKGVFPAMRGTESSSVEEIKREVAERVVSAEPRGILSPGAMSNAPDRLDGFHTYNLCCRGKQDTGRASENLRTYGVDRRAFEHWCEGDWSAANFLMTQVGEGACARCGVIGQLTADHVGPISLGFAHSPYFDAVCLACNSSKNNRMSLRDVERLSELEQNGEVVVSWQARPLWDRCKQKVKSDEQALLLSKLMRVNQHHCLLLLAQALDHGLPDVLLQLLMPEHSGYRTRFNGLDPSTLRYTGITRRRRQDTYARSQGARMVRIAFGALKEYASKIKRKVHFVDEHVLAPAQLKVDTALDKAARSSGEWREELVEILVLEPAVQDARLALLFRSGYKPPDDYDYVREAFNSYLDSLAAILARRFDEGRADRLGDELDEAWEELRAT
jgi:Alw26I/Eco31I/Esp3I family type II restriction endonuclease